MVNDEEPTGPVDQMIDLFIYAPLGFALDARSLLPRFINRGRGQVVLARTIGQYALKRGNNVAETTLSSVVRRLSGDEGDDTAADEVKSESLAETDLDDRLAETSETSSVDEPPVETGSDSRSDAPSPAENLENDVDIDPATLAIPDYDSLSASQVVPRLASLSSTELTSVGDYERANRGRKTILNRVAQLHSS